ncbi:MAG: secretin and TonB N-terminal domain-containing protein [Candidatus Omnitrophica bacterium]|nr:secretin and TonB N-terminal domain-containing protein [Candidatus Omnitrophota bacterium]
MKAINRFSRKRIFFRLFICSMLFAGIIIPASQVSFADENEIENSVDEEAAEGVANKNYGQKLLSMTLKDTDLREVLNMLAFKGGVNIIAGEDVDSKVNVQLNNVPWEQALDVILKTYNYTYKREDNLIRVMSLARSLVEESKLPLETRIVPLNFAKVTDLKESLGKILSKRGTIEVDARTNSLIITDVPETVQKVELAATELDTRTPQVLIEAMMVDVKITDNDEWGSIITQLTNLKSYNNSNTLTTSLPVTQTNNISFSSATDNFDIAGIIDLWVYQNKATILASPKVLTLDNQEAKIEIIEKIPYVETVDTGGGATSNIKFEEAGVKLSVTPHITSGRFISMNVKPEQSFSTGSFGGRPVIDERKAETNLLVRDGQTIIIGGLRQSTDTYSYEKLPVLGDIPFLGMLFKKKQKIKVETELVLFVTPHIILQSMLTNREIELYEKLGNREMIVIDERTEMQRLTDFAETVKQKLKAKKIAEKEVSLRKKIGQTQIKEKTSMEEKQNYNTLMEPREMERPEAEAEKLESL